MVGRKERSPHFPQPGSTRISSDVIPGPQPPRAYSLDAVPIPFALERDKSEDNFNSSWTHARKLTEGSGDPCAQTLPPESLSPRNLDHATSLLSLLFSRLSFSFDSLPQTPVVPLSLPPSPTLVPPPALRTALRQRSERPKLETPPRKPANKTHGDALAPRLPSPPPPRPHHILLPGVPPRCHRRAVPAENLRRIQCVGGGTRLHWRARFPSRPHCVSGTAASKRKVAGA